MKRLTLFMFLVAAVGSSGCSLDAGDGSSDVDDEEHVDVAKGAITESNALSLNALSLNALSLNALSSNALNLNGLSANTLSALQDPGPSGDLARQLVRYAASCALSTSQSFQYNWTDSNGVAHTETNWGALGLASTWATTALTPAGEKLVSACLIARVNWYGVRVVISLRGVEAELAATAEERANYSIVEGAFWGNIFSTSPTAYSCYAASNVERARARMRDCAAGHLDPTMGVESCGIINIVGSCEARCDALNSVGTYYTGCAAAGSTYSGSIITSWLQE